MSVGEEIMSNPSPSDFNGSVATTSKQTTSVTDGPSHVRENAKDTPTDLIAVQSGKDVSLNPSHNQSSSIHIIPGNSTSQNNKLNSLPSATGLAIVKAQLKHLKDGDPKGEGISHALHECDLAPLIDHRNDSRTPITISTQPNTAQGPFDDHCKEEQHAAKRMDKGKGHAVHDALIQHTRQKNKPSQKKRKALQRKNAGINIVEPLEEPPDLGFYGPRYTWSTGWGPCSIVWKRLDRGLANDNWLSSFPATTITHLASAGSDHSPLLMEMNVTQNSFKKYFRFLNCWVKNESFMPLVQEVWNSPINGSAMWIFHQKLKVLSSALSKWSDNNMVTSFRNPKNLNKRSKKQKKNGQHPMIQGTDKTCMIYRLNIPDTLKLEEKF
ncbi:hypothetical protein A4A49_17458 [Nicotiana attenuata]|uniref:DUF4283 domain-containing protein n=1 Tax=Nicotiana attenuata TaxID=49451 RepID=A0A1J6I997_NICAT|nr:hypothetical protein A4A49_17458 [Nicotiana attenuata]